MKQQRLKLFEVPIYTALRVVLLRVSQKKIQFTQASLQNTKTPRSEKINGSLKKKNKDPLN